MRLACALQLPLGSQKATRELVASMLDAATPLHCAALHGNAALVRSCILLPLCQGLRCLGTLAAHINAEVHHGLGNHTVNQVLI